MKPVFKKAMMTTAAISAAGAIIFGRDAGSYLSTAFMACVMP